MANRKPLEAVVTKTGQSVTENYCRKCMRNLPAKNFYECTDEGFIDANGLLSVCKDCINATYDSLYDELNSVEKAIHKLCTTLNVKYSNDAMSATRAHINTLLEKGKNVNAVFGIYKMKLIATNKSMDKTSMEDMTYNDVNTIFTSEDLNTKELPIPQDVVTFWGSDLPREDIIFLEEQYASFKQTSSTVTYTEIVLLKQICYTLLDIKYMRAQGDDPLKTIDGLQRLMKSLNITPDSAESKADAEGEAILGLWIKDIEEKEPAEWLLSDPRGDIYRDVGNVELYFQNYFVRPLKNLMLTSKDFTITEENQVEEVEYNEDDLFDGIDDGYDEEGNE